MALKIWYQSGVDFDHHPGYRDALTRRFVEVASAGTTVSLHGTDKRFNRGLVVDDCISSPWAYQMTYVPMFFQRISRSAGSLSEPMMKAPWPVRSASCSATGCRSSTPPRRQCCTPNTSWR